MAGDHLGEVKDLVATPLMHDSPGEIAQPDVKDWRTGECEPKPGKTMPNLAVVTRDYANVYRMMTALGPLAASAGVGSKGIMWKAGEEVELLKASLGSVEEAGVSQGQPSMQTAGPGNQRRDRGQGVDGAGKTVRSFPETPQSAPPGRTIPFRRPDRPAAKDHYFSDLERDRIR
jgi:hypothetical protein